MSELVVCINLKESKKRHFLIFETYTATKIKTTKNKQFSGQLQKIDCNTANEFGNMNSETLSELQQLLRTSGNIQFSKYQFSITPKTLPSFEKFIKLRFFFYCDKDNHFHLLESLTITENDKITNGEIKDVSYINNGSALAFSIVKNQTDKNTENSVFAKFYIDISTKQYNASLFFEYENAELKCNDTKTAPHLSITRDYFFEKNIFSLLNKNGWRSHTDFFEYTGKNIIASINELQNAGIKLYTSAGKKQIFASRFVDSSISYGIDWFNFDANIQINDKKISANELFDLKTKKNNWIELDNQIVLLPEEYIKYKNIFSVTENHIKIEKRNIGQVLAFSHDIGIDSVKNIDALTDFSKIEPHTDEKLYSLLKLYQKTGVQWLLYLHKNDFGGCLADDMGLGKTIQVLAYLSDEIFKNSCNLIIIPKTLLENWKREIQKFLPTMSFYIYHNKDRDIRVARKSTIILTTYGMVINDFDTFIETHFENIIVDEAQNIKNRNSLAYKSIAKLNAKTKLLLTGTPFENNVKEFISLMNLVNPGLFDQFPKIAESNTNTISRIKTISSPFVLQRLKKDVLKELPEKSEQTIYCTMDVAQKELYDTMLKSIQYEIKRKPARFEIKSNSLILNGLLYLQQICCHPKLLPHDLNMEKCLESAKTEMIMTMLQTLCATDHKTVVFSRFTKMLNILKDLLIKSGIHFYYLDGQTRNRMGVVDDFEKSVNSVFLVSLKAGGVGLNLTSADTAIIYDPWWNPAIEKQAEDRIYRIGQKKNVTIYRLIMSNTIEEKIEELKQKKKEIANQILEDEDSVTGIDMDILRNLILEEK